MGSQQVRPEKKQQAYRHMAKGREKDAIAILQKVIKSSPKDPEALYMLGCNQAKLALWNEAIKALQASINAQPNVPQSHFALAGAYLANGQTNEALTCLEMTLKLNECMPEAHVALANVLIAQGQTMDAREHLERALELDPKMSDAHVGLGKTEQEHGEHRKAISHIEKALLYDSNNIKALCAMATSLSNLAQKKKARVYYKKALHIDPGCLEAVCGRAMMYNFDGEYNKAIDLIEPLLEKGIKYPMLAVVFLQCCKLSGRCQEAIDYANTVLKQENLPRSSSKALHFTAAKILDRMGQYDEAFLHYRSGNETIRHLYDSVLHTQFISEYIDIFTPELFMRIPRAQNHDERPIFIVGMPRSGTSLTEQILAAHSKVYAAGELQVLSNTTRKISLEAGLTQTFPHYIDQLAQQQLDKMAKQYLDWLTGLNKTSLRITDKMPHNFFLLGLIQILFPDARVVHCCRDPMDTCLSIYFQDFNEQHKYAKSLFDIGTHYHQYERLMKHWKQVLTIPMLDINYEEMVGDQENVTRRLLEFCGLDWEESCLHFHNLKRTVDTASYEQVRQPLYSKSVARWRHYGKYLDELKEGLQRSY